MSIEPLEPPSGDVFTMSNGEKIRINYDNIFMYKSSQKTSNTVVELGYVPNTETIILDISFDNFDQKFQENRRLWKEYWRSERSNLPY